MTYYRDMGMRTMVTAGRSVRAIGWLHCDAPFSKGDVSKGFLSRLKQFSSLWLESSRSLGWGLFRGFHTCEFCGKIHSSGNFGVPFKRWLFVMPAMVDHYVEFHNYAPPAVFQAAILSSPLPGTEQYRAAVARFRALHLHAAAQRRRRWRRAGGRELARHWDEGDRITVETFGEQKKSGDPSRSKGD